MPPKSAFLGIPSVAQLLEQRKEGPISTLYNLRDKRVKTKIADLPKSYNVSASRELPSDRILTGFFDVDWISALAIVAKRGPSSFPVRSTLQCHRYVRC